MTRLAEFGSQVRVHGSIIPAGRLTPLCYQFRGVGGAVAMLLPGLEMELRQADVPLEKEIFGAALFLNAALFFAIGTIIASTFAVLLSGRGVPFFTSTQVAQIAFAGGAFFAIAFGARIIAHPKIQLKKKARDIERNMIFALRTLLVEVRSGVTLFDAINSVANSSHGQVSVEFRKAVNRIDTGTFQNDALEEMAQNNPSLHFRRAIWQLVNGLKAGSDVSIVMESLVETLAIEKSNQIKRYGNSLKMLSLLYMMLGAIVPALGLTLLIILSTFPQVKITETVFWAMFFLIIFGQFMFTGIMKNSRPGLLGDQ